MALDADWAKTIFRFVFLFSTPEGSTDRKAPLRKGSSNMSSRSSNQIDDLLDEMM